jgi:hypothetical protein
MTGMHKGYAYRSSNFITYKKQLQQRTKYLDSLNQTKTCRGIEPQFYEELCPIAKQVP